jgi:predicted lipoprotein with Yx(FWY)xxD motif
LILLFALAVLSALALAAESDSFTVKVAQDKFLGNYLVNQSGFTLYYYQNDSKTIGTGTSTCYDNCSVLWPPFYAAELTLPENLRSIDFGEITRTDGLKQTTFMGWPLYLYSKDNEPEETQGQGVDGIWHVIDPDNQPQMI